MIQLMYFIIMIKCQVVQKLFIISIASDIIHL